MHRACLACAVPRSLCGVGGQATDHSLSLVFPPFPPPAAAGSLVQSFSLGGADGAPSPHCSYSVTRPNLQRALYAALPPGTVACGAAFCSFRLLGDGRVEVALALGGNAGGSQGACDAGTGGGRGASGDAGAAPVQEGSGAGRQEQQTRVEVCDLLVGADGIRSRVRACLEGGWEVVRCKANLPANAGRASQP